MLGVVVQLQHHQTWNTLQKQKYEYVKFRNGTLHLNHIPGLHIFLSPIARKNTRLLVKTWFFWSIDYRQAIENYFHYERKPVYTNF